MIRHGLRACGHCEGSVGSNAFSGSNGIGSPACAGGAKEKGSRSGSLCLFDGSRSEHAFEGDAALGRVSGRRVSRPSSKEHQGVYARLHGLWCRVTRRRTRGRDGGLRSDRRRRFA
jgi:hypothetical protein